MKNLLFLLFILAFIQINAKNLVVTPLSEIEIKEHNFKLETTLEGNKIVEFYRDIDIKSSEIEDSDCSQNCELWGANCSCGASFTFQWCPCPWFPPTPQAMGSALCQQACNNQ